MNVQSRGANKHRGRFETHTLFLTSQNKHHLLAGEMLKLLSGENLPEMKKIKGTKHNVQVQPGPSVVDTKLEDSIFL